MKIHSENIDTSINKNVRCESECVVPLRKESIRSYLLILFSKSKSNNTNEFSASSYYIRASQSSLN